MDTTSTDESQGSRHTGTPSNPPIFLFGFERSGTTLLSMMAGAHPELAVPLTVTGLWYRYARLAEDYGDLRDPSNLARLIADLLAEERIRLWDVPLTTDEVLDGWSATSFADVVARFHALYAARHGKPRWGNLDIATLDDMDIANRWFPDAKFVHIVRDGRDVALSHETMPYGASNVLECALTWDRRLRTNMKMGAILGPARYRVIRYEDLVVEPEPTLEAMCEFMGLGFSEAMLDYPRMVDEKIPPHRRWLWPAIDKAPDRSKVFGWKHRMSSAKRLVFEAEAGDLLREFGYETLGSVPKSARRYALETWYFLGRGGRLKRLSSWLGVARLSKLERHWLASGRSTRPDHRQVQQDAFSSLVGDGTYGLDFEHAEPARRFFERVYRHTLEKAGAQRPRAVLECGCGPGAWLDVARRLHDSSAAFPTPVLYGFDITQDMVTVARERLAAWTPADNLGTGDILDDNSYRFAGVEGGFGTVFAYDVVQQLPRKLQYQACRTMVHHVAPGGVAIVFDHDRFSRYGLKMEFRKFVTSNLGIELVPPYYCNARYPALARIARKLEEEVGVRTEILVDDNRRKRALVIQVPVRAAGETAQGGPQGAAASG